MDARGGVPSGTEYVADIDLIRANVPGALVERQQWVCWRYENRGGKPTKVPVDPKTGALASTTDAATWGTLDQAVNACLHHDELTGVGFVFAADDPLAGVDFDNCIDPTTGEIKPWAGDLLNQLDSYAETSPSGLGVKVFVLATKRDKRCRRKYHDGIVECYDQERFFTVTGQRLPDRPADVEPRQSELDAIHSTVFGAERASVKRDHPQTASTDGNGSSGPSLLSDEEIIQLAKSKRRTGSKFEDLWDGKWQAHFPSASEADSSLVFTLAFYTKDASQIDRIFRRSGLMRDKWDEQHGAQTYGQLTISRALEHVTAQFKSRKLAPLRIIKMPTSTDRPKVITTDTQLSDLTQQAMDALRQGNDPPVVFVRSGALVRIVTDEHGNPQIDSYDRVRMRCRLTEVADFYHLRGSENGSVEVAVAPSLTLAENILALGAWDFPVLRGIARTPIVRRDGSICMDAGYDPPTGLVYCPTPVLQLGEIPEQPNVHEVQACVDQLLKVLLDFPFADQPSRANALSILFSPLIRPVIDGHVPLAIVDAPVQGTGKTLLVNLLAIISHGSIASESIPSKQNDDEWRKKITSILLHGSPLVLLDNIPDNSIIDSPALAAALTTHEWSDRRLGHSESIRVPSRSIWIATGNNLRVGGDMPRRTYTIRLDAQAERPWERTGFRIADIEGYVRSHRGDLLAAALTIIRAWFVARQPAANVRPLGSFEEWSKTIAGIFACAGIEGFLENMDQTRTMQDEDTEQWTSFVDAWWDKFGSEPITVNDLCLNVLANGQIENVTVPEVLLVNRDRGDGSLRRSLGRHLSRLTGRVFNGRKLCAAGAETHKKVKAWALRPISGVVS